jgi:hypothetical protein
MEVEDVIIWLQSLLQNLRVSLVFVGEYMQTVHTEYDIE